MKINWKEILIGAIGCLVIAIVATFVVWLVVSPGNGMNEFFILSGISLVFAAIIYCVLVFLVDLEMGSHWLNVPLMIAVILINSWFLTREAKENKELPAQSTSSTDKIQAQLDNANAKLADAIAERDAAQTVYSIAQNKIDELQKDLNKCKGIEEPLTPEEEIAKLKREVAALKNAPKQKGESKPADVVEKNFGTGGSFKPSNTTTTEETFPADNTSLPITQYEGGFAGAYCSTINDDGYLVYGLKNTPDITQTPLLNGESGPEMTLDKESGYWYYIDYNHLVSVQEINNWSYALEWNVYKGQTNYGTGSYPTYLPHQSLKPLINRVRGKEWGEITDDDLVKMRKENPDIWTPESEGTLRPFRLDATNGRAYGKEDKNLYQGWNFRTKIYAKKRTTVQ